MSDETSYLVSLFFYYVVYFFVFGFMSRFEWFLNLMRSSANKGSSWPILLGATVVFVPLAVPVAGSLGALPIGELDYDSPPLMLAGLGMVFVFPLLWIASVIYSAIRANVRGESGPIQLTSPAVCRGKRDLESVMLCVSKKLEKLLSEWYGAEGKGLHEKMTSVEGELDPQDVKAIRYIASVRNQVTHDEDFDARGVDRNDILETAASVTHRLAKQKGVNVGVGILDRLDQTPGLRVFASPLAFAGGLLAGFGWVSALFSVFAVSATILMFVLV
ncbi:MULTISPECIES: hypothetical protein [unclassified Thioalkalivibrio]|uniref:hypothetical protein n=1 Tax=unclassified Thioalkalivibrio TaxID=2621013 RepID=UPI001E2BAB13|nr:MULTISPECIES: hypothetical protein [unclassified Thioalkalivibrio]